MRRLFAAVGTIFASAIAFSQLSDARLLMGPAYADLAYRNSFALRLIGTESWRGRPQAIDVSVAWRFTRTAEKALAELDIQSFVGNNLVERYAGDGANLWHYDAVANSYWSANYGSADGVQTAGYVRRLMQILSSTSAGNLKFVARLLFDTLGATSTAARIDSLWQPWLPNSRVTVGGNTVIAEVGDPVRLRVDYDTVLVEDIRKLSAISFWEYDIRGGMAREIDWTLSVLPLGPEVGAERFKFIAPRDAKLIAHPFRASGSL